MRLRSVASLLLALATLLSAGTVSHGSGPRWVTGAPYYYPAGYPVVWYTNQLAYFTDPGDLSAYVNHAAADALVAAAASVWNIPTSLLVLSYGGALAEHVSSANVTFGASGLVFPAEVQSSNYAAIPIAVLYDSDGSVTDLMLGSGASNPVNCRHAGVTESEDSINTSGHIQHALLVLNGRCTGPAPEQQLQLRYQLMRAFGRILGLGWSQANDNVFTGTPTPTNSQALNWPIMHPIDIICGPYTYQCLPQPFTLRDDDIASLELLYTVDWWHHAPGKQNSGLESNQVEGYVTFPNGQGMQGVNVVVQRFDPFWSVPNPWQTVSSVSGYLFRRNAGNPVVGPPAASVRDQGTDDQTREGYYNLFGVPLKPGEVWQDLMMYTEPINPLYTGEYAVGPYDSNGVMPSGTTTTKYALTVGSYSDTVVNLPASTSVTSCAASSDGTESAPVAINSKGWWNGTVCGYGHSAWSSFAIQPQRSFTLEVTALDEQGFATSSKAMPALGLWNKTDALGTLPTVAAAPEAFNGIASGMTSLTLASAAQPQQLRMVIADQRGDGRPDYAYQARLYYADAITPATVPAAGGTVTITGTGFRAGNSVTVNGVAAEVSSWTTTSITATVPSLHALGSTTAITADVTVKDLFTGGTTTMTSALGYVAQPTLLLVSAPSGSIFTGAPATAAFTVQAFQADGVTPIAGQSITFTASAGQVEFNACGASTCTLLTDSSGRASTTVTPLSPGATTLSAASSVGTQTASFTAMARVQTITALNPSLYVAAGATASWTPQVVLADNAASTIGVAVQWQPTAGAITLAPSLTLTDAQSTAQTSAVIGPLAAGVQATASVCAWATVCTTFTAQAVDPSQWQLQIVSGAGQSLSAANTFAPVVLAVTDSASHPIAGAVVQVHQTLEPWGAPCPDRGRCPIAPVYGSSTASLTAGPDGLVTITPLEASNSPEITNIAAAAGTQGFVSLTLQKQH